MHLAHKFNFKIDAISFNLSHTTKKEVTVLDPNGARIQNEKLKEYANNVVKSLKRKK